MIKKLTSLLLAAILICTVFTACGEDHSPKDNTTTPSPSVGEQTAPTQEPTEETQPTERVKEFPLEIAPTESVPTPEAAANVTPEEFADILVVENLAPFTGQFMECEPSDFVRLYDVYALGITNISDRTIETLTLVYNNGEQDLTFYAEMIPAGWTIVVMDTEGREATTKNLSYVSCELSYLEVGREVTHEVELTETANGTVIVKNMSEGPMPVVTVYYRDVDYNGNILAGRCFRATTTMELIPGWKEEIETDQWLPSCVVVNVVVEDTPIAEEE